MDKNFVRSRLRAVFDPPTGETCYSNYAEGARCGLPKKHEGPCSQIFRGEADALYDEAFESRTKRVPWILTGAQAQVVYDALGAYTGYCSDRNRDAPLEMIRDLRNQLERLRTGKP